MKESPAKLPRPSSSKIAFAALPEDLQVLISQFSEWDDGIERDIPAFLPTVMVPVAGIPVVELDPYDRGRDHAHSMDLNETPPLVIAHGLFLDGKHRAFRARHLNWPALVAIDLTDVISREMAESNGMGAIDFSAEFDRDAPPPASPYAEPDMEFAAMCAPDLLQAFEETDEERFASRSRDALEAASKALPGLFAELDWKQRDRAPEFEDTSLRLAAAVVEANVRTKCKPSRDDLATAYELAKTLMPAAPRI